MKTWNFQVKNSPKEISEKLQSSLGNANKFVLNLNNDRINPVKFKIRKRLLLAFEINVQNNIIVNGKFLKAASKKGTNVEISFNQHPLAKLLLFGYIILGVGLLAGIILELNNNSTLYITTGVLLIIGFLLAIQLKKNFDKNVQEYKKLISEILEPQTIKNIQ